MPSSLSVNVGFCPLCGRMITVDGRPVKCLQRAAVFPIQSFDDAGLIYMKEHLGDGEVLVANPGSPA